MCVCVCLWVREMVKAEAAAAEARRVADAAVAGAIDELSLDDETPRVGLADDLLARAYAVLDVCDSDTADVRAEKVLEGLGFTVRTTDGSPVLWCTVAVRGTVCAMLHAVDDASGTHVGALGRLADARCACARALHQAAAVAAGRANQSLGCACGVTFTGVCAHDAVSKTCRPFCGWSRSCVSLIRSLWWFRTIAAFSTPSAPTPSL